MTARSNAEKKAWLKGQISARVELLERWVSAPPRNGEELPFRLAHVRRWQRPAEGIEPIGSSSSFVTTHPEYGRSIKRIEAALKELNSHRRRGSGGAEEKESSAARRKALTNVADQVASLKAELLVSQRDLRLASVTISQQDSRIAELTQELRSVQSGQSDGRGGKVRTLRGGRRQ